MLHFYTYLTFGSLKKFSLSFLLSSTRCVVLCGIFCSTRLISFVFFCQSLPLADTSLSLWPCGPSFQEYCFRAEYCLVSVMIQIFFAFKTASLLCSCVNANYFVCVCACVRVRACVTSCSE